MGINLFYRCMLNATDSKLFLCAIRQLPSNVWDDTASILFIDYQQEVFSALTMCATYKSSCCSFNKKKKRSFSPRKGGNVNLKMNQQKKAVHQYSFMQNVHCQEEIETVMSAAFICHLPPGMLI